MIEIIVYLHIYVHIDIPYIHKCIYMYHHQTLISSSNMFPLKFNDRTVKLSYHKGDNDDDNSNNNNNN
jgi:hypothetical protein